MSDKVRHAPKTIKISENKKGHNGLTGLTAPHSLRGLIIRFIDAYFTTRLPAWIVNYILSER